MCQRGAECQVPAQHCQLWDFSEELERITKSQQEWLPGGEKAGAGQRSRLEQSKRENSEARTLVTQANNSLSTNGNSPEPENTCLPQLWPFSTSRKFVTVLRVKRIHAGSSISISYYGELYFFCASTSILIERNVIVELFIFPRCHCHIEVTKGIGTLGEKRNHFTGNKFNYCTSLQRVLLRVSLQHWSLKAYQEPRGESESRPQVWNSIIVPFLLERVLLQVSLLEGFACSAVY